MNQHRSLFSLLLALAAGLVLLSPVEAAGQSLFPDSPPDINVWYGSHQVFGDPGVHQRWANILGNVSDPDGVKSLVYSLNGRAPVTLSIGPDGKRLASAGDFNVDLDFANLSPGSNTVAITATDNLGNKSTETVTVEYVSGRVWPRSYTIDWSSVGAIQDVAKVVDGHWRLEADSIRPVVAGYDRLVAIGDVTWENYEVLVPITIHNIYYADPPGVGILMRWGGHTDDPVSGWQPKTGYFPLGAIGWARWYDNGASGSLHIYGNEGRTIANVGRRLSLGVRYYFRMRVETNPGQGGIYSLKVWEASKPEPSGWDVSGQEGLEDPQNGTLLLLAHRVDASFGDVTISPLGEIYDLTVGIEGKGSVARDPDQPTYAADQDVMLTPVPDIGWEFSGWSGPGAGDLSNNGDGTWTLTMDADKSLTASFTQYAYDVAVTVQGQGSVLKTPGPPYLPGNDVILEPVADENWRFDGWSDPDAGLLSDNGDGTWTMTMDRDKSLTATFTKYLFDVAVTTEGQGSVVKTPDPPYLEGTDVTLEPIPAERWAFDGWSGPDAGLLNDNGDGTWTMTVGGDHALTATFIQVIFDVAVTTVGQGTVDHTPGNSYAYGDVATLEPLPDPGWHFVGWSGPHAGDLEDQGDGTWRMTIDADKAVTATFSDQYLLAVDVVGSGGVQKQPDQAGYYPGDQVTLTPAPAPGWEFAGWDGPDTGDLADQGDGTWTLTMDADKSLKATFTAIQYSVTVTMEGSGTVGHTPGNPHGYGEVVTLAPVPDPGWEFAGWDGPDAGDLNDQGAGTWTLTMDADKAVTAWFTSGQYFVAVTMEGNGRVDHTPGNPYGYGEVATLTPVPDPGWEFAGWGGPDAADLDDQGDGTWTLVMGTNRAVMANFARGQYQVTVMVEGLGSVSHLPGNPYAYGEMARLEPIPEGGWGFGGWEGLQSGELADNGDGTWSLVVDGHKEVTARFERATYEVLVMVEGQGMVRDWPGSPYSYLEVATLEPIPAPGWQFAGWGGPDAAHLSDNGDGTWSLRMTADKALTITFVNGLVERVYLPLMLR